MFQLSRFLKLGSGSFPSSGSSPPSPTSLLCLTNLNNVTYILTRIPSSSCIIHACRVGTTTKQNKKKKNKRSAFDHEDVPSKKQKTNAGKKSTKISNQTSSRRQPSLCNGVISFHFPANVISFNSINSNSSIDTTKTTESEATDNSFVAVLANGDVWECRLRGLPIETSSIDLDTTILQESWQTCIVNNENEKDRCTKLIHVRAASECLPVGNSTYFIRSLIEPLTQLIKGESSVIQEFNVGTSRITTLTKCSRNNMKDNAMDTNNVSTNIYVGNVDGEVLHHSNNNIHPIELCGNQALGEPVLHVYNISWRRNNHNNNNNNNNKSNAMIVVGVLGAISIVQGNNSSTPPASSSSSNTSPPPTICTSRLSNVSVNNPITSIGITSSSNNERTQIYYVTGASRKLYCVDLMNMMTAVSNPTSSNSCDEMLLSCVTIPIASALAVSVLDEQIYVIDGRHRIYQVKDNSNHIQQVRNNLIVNNESESNGSEKSLQELLTGIGDVKSTRFALLTESIQLDTQLREISTAVRWYLRARNVSSHIDIRNHSMSPLSCNVDLLPCGPNTTMSAITGRYVLRVRLRGLANSNAIDTSALSNQLPYHLAHILAFPTSETWRIAIRIEQKSSIDGSLRSEYRTIPLSSMLPEIMGGGGSSNSSSGSSSSSSMEEKDMMQSDLESRVVELNLKRMVSTELFNVHVSIIYPISNTTTTKTSKTMTTTHGMSVPLEHFTFDMIDTCVPTTPLSLPSRVITRTEDELVCDIRTQIQPMSNVSGSGSRSGSRSGPGSLFSSVEMTIRHDVTSIAVHFLKIAAQEKTQEKDIQKNQKNTSDVVANVSSSSSSSSSTTNQTISIDVDRDVCGRLIASILGSDGQRWKWERSSSPGYVASHGMLWGGNQMKLISRLVRNGTIVFLEIRVSCTDPSRLPMLRECLARRMKDCVRTILDKEENEEKAEEEEEEEDEEESNDETKEKNIKSRRTKMSMQVDQTLRGVEQTLSSCRLRLMEISKSLKSGTNDSLDMSATTSIMKQLYNDVTRSYNILRSV